ncbi:MAG: hypothetical protein FIA97_15430 [Methylococcaceae bacterium]|nr:hypothetical protein [Methylococcaceae bacterium]
MKPKTAFRSISPALVLSALVSTGINPAWSAPARTPLHAKSENVRRLPPSATPEERASLRDSMNRSTWDEFQKVSPEVTRSSNVVLSAMDRSILLNQAMLGAKEISLENLQEEAHASLPDARLHPAANSLGQELAQANGGAGFEQHGMLWGQGRHAGKRYLFADSFVRKVIRHYGFGLQPVDYMGHLPAGDGWLTPWLDSVMETPVTVGLSSSRATRMKVAHTTRVEGSWNGDVQAVENRRFEPLTGVPKSVAAVRFSGLLAGAETEDLKAVELPLNGSDLALLVIMPSAGQFDSVRSQLGADFLNDVVGQLQLQERSWVLPVMQMAYDSSHAGSGSPYNPGEADFSGVNGRGYLYLEGIGTQAAMNLTAQGLSSESVAIASYSATGPEPDDVYSGGNGPYGYGAGLVNVCAEEPHWNSELADVRPFFYFLRDRQNDLIISAGSVVQVAGPAVPPDWVTYPCSLVVTGPEPQ